MREGLVRYYARVADQKVRGWDVYGGDANVASLRAFRAYHPDARVAFTDVEGIQRWMTQKQARIHAVLLRQAVADDGSLLQVRAVAKETQTCPSTVSRAVLKFQSWGMFGAIMVRGRNGGMYVFARAVGDTLQGYADRARHEIGVLRMKAEARRIRKTGNVASYTYKGRDEGVTDATISGMPDPASLTPFTRAAMRERARLAIADPDGEERAFMPLTREQAYKVRDRYAEGPHEQGGMDMFGPLGCDPNRTQGRATCPAHGEGRSKTLSWKRTPQGGLLVHCFAGCTYADIRKALGL